MKNEEKKAMVIERFIENDVFNKSVEELRKIYDYAKDNEWSLHLRRKNEVFLYYKGIVLKIKLYKDKQRFSLNASASTRKKKNLEELFGIAKPINQLSLTIRDVMDKFSLAMEDTEFLKRQIERQKEQIISMALESNDEFFIIDMEVVITGKADEGDLLALVKNVDDTYRFMPIEVKLAGKDCTTAVTQGVEFLERIKDNYDDFKNNYMQVYNQKWVKLLNKRPINITDNWDINEVLILIITENKMEIDAVIDAVIDDAKKIPKYKVKVLPISEQEFIDLKWREQIDL